MGPVLLRFCVVYGRGPFNHCLQGSYVYMAGRSYSQCTLGLVYGRALLGVLCGRFFIRGGAQAITAGPAYFLIQYLLNLRQIRMAFMTQYVLT